MPARTERYVRQPDDHSGGDGYLFGQEACINYNLENKIAQLRKLLILGSTVWLQITT